MTLWMNEQEAKEKWCPHAVASHTDPRGVLPPIDDNAGRFIHNCIGSKCMAWRWVRTNIADDNGDLRISSTDTYGFCGLAGTPSYDK